MPQNQPTESIVTANRAWLDRAEFRDTADFADADRGFLGTRDDPAIRRADGTVVFDPSDFEFLTGDAPDSVNPSLWRQGELIRRHGLYEVVDGLYQVRGFDLSVMSLIEGDTGVIVVDPLVSQETAAAALELYRAHRGDRPVAAVIFTHSHIDHFGGVLGIVDPADVEAGRVAVVAPEGFLEHAIEENVYAGTAMARRASYMYGAVLPRGPLGQVGSGLGPTNSIGTPGILPPTLSITPENLRHTIDGVEFEFQLAPNSEAPAEMHFYLPRFRALCMAENATHNLHNLLTLRGALVRDPRMWSRYLTEAIEQFAGRSDVLFASHHWPTWGNDRILHFLGVQRDLYAYLHDQTLRLLNQGLNGAEIAEGFRMPPALEAEWSTHGYYGSVSHNVRAIYQRYMGFFDGNPSRLWPHPPVEQAQRWAALVGGVDALIAGGREAYAAGDYRWAATVLDTAVFADPQNDEAKALLADTYEQLGYGAENATWRNFYLSGATELRDGNFGTPIQANAPTIVAHLSPDQLFDAIAIQIDGPAAWDLDLAMDVTFSDLGRSFRITLHNGVLVHVEKEPAADAQLHLTATHPRFLALAAGDTASPGLTLDGDASVLTRLTAVLDPGDPDFEIVVP
ncbi:alkyl sulfatase dimerization domain-containing protein [Leifsonia shinshuensis]|uniref:alkyl/aryl-sulfatase n=1 Tax=Leifsonia shinshuensis TaxID=150026 RepID=UPI002857278B|nr:alkyl sulfatase dimerization domain-containing protein [Leifsonia shinshuensis]MDR6970540.1 alkyl sulfatase BDS1-like metallo-beta-lactamase superfamily hydrolase [Leifsonia shinshuensis]